VCVCVMACGPYVSVLGLGEEPRVVGGQAGRVAGSRGVASHGGPASDSSPIHGALPPGLVAHGA